jgi:polysaccharide deacetylase 2 family uncharacterized protein YibQ
MARRRRSRGAGRGGVWLFVLGVLVGAGVLYLVFRDQRYAPESRSEAPEARPSVLREEPAGPAQAKTASSVQESEMPSLPPEAPDTEPVADGETHLPGHVALVIDDLGERPEDLATLLALGVPVTYAVLPYEKHTQEVVAELRRRHVEMLLHLPMEPLNGEDPGPGALLTGMDDDELREKTEAALRAVPGAVGVNNHMGSRLSEDERALTPVLRVLAEHGLFFLDSRTSASSVGYRTARSLGLPSVERHVFLDRDPSPEAVRKQFQRLLELSRTRGAAVAIGHPLPDTLQVLTEEVPKARAEGFEFVPVSDLLDRGDGAE